MPTTDALEQEIKDLEAALIILQTKRKEVESQLTYITLH